MKNFLILMGIAVGILAFVYAVEPLNVVIVENAGQIVRIDKKCEAAKKYIKQNGKRKIVALERDCRKIIKVSWCKYPTKKQGCYFEFVDEEDSWRITAYKKYLRTQNSDKYAHHYMDWYRGKDAFRKGEVVSVAYLEGAWFRQKSTQYTIMLFKWLKKK